MTESVQNNLVKSHVKWPQKESERNTKSSVTPWVPTKVYVRFVLTDGRNVKVRDAEGNFDSNVLKWEYMLFSYGPGNYR